MSRLRVIFDLDDTLYPERSFAISAFEAVGAWAQQALQVDGLGHDMVRLLDDGHLGKIFRKALEQRGIDAAHAPRLIEVYRQHQPGHLTLYPDAGPALDRVASASPIGLITDGTVAVQQAKVRALGIASRFQRIIYTHEAGGRDFAKPHAGSFEAMQAALGAPGDRFVYVGDNPAKDFLAPNRMGWTTVQVVRPQRIHAGAIAIEGGAAQHVVETLADLPAIIEL
jgi:putative hydrolase of the HAD superfamily